MNVIAKNTKIVRTVCRSCWAGCGIMVEVAEDGHVVGVRGDREHPLSQGYMCPKGNAIPYGHHRADRLNAPLMHGTSCSWDALLDDLTKTIEKSIALHGPDAVGSYSGSGSGILDTLGTRALRRFLAAVGSKERFSPSTVDVAPALRASELVSGYSYELIPRWVPEDDQSKLVVFIGTNPLVSHGYFTVLPNVARRLRAFRQRGGCVWVIDPNRTRTARVADGHVAPKPGTDPFILAWLVRDALDRLTSDAPATRTTKAEDRARLRTALEPFDLERVAALSGVDINDLAALTAEIRASGRIAVVSGTGLTFSANGIMGEWLRWALLALTDSLDKPGGMWIDPGWLVPLDKRESWSPAPADGNIEPGPISRPDLPRFLGETPCAAMADEIEHGPLRVLFVTGGSPLTAVPNPVRLEQAFRSLNALAVFDVTPTPLTAMATHLMPGPGQLERLDLSGFWFSRAQLAVPAVGLVGERKPLWWIIGHVAKRMGLLKQVLDDCDPDAVREMDLMRFAVAGARNTADELFAAGPHGLQNPRLENWAVGRAAPDGAWRIAPQVMLDRLPALLASAQEQQDLMLICRRQARRVNSTENAPEGEMELPELLMSPHDAERSQIMNGRRVRVRSTNGEVSVVVRVDEKMRPGVVSLPHGWYEANVTQLTSCEDIDPLTSQPQMSAIPVSVTLDRI